MRTNNKYYKSWEKEDIESILNNDSYIESDYIDYKISFAHLEESAKQNKLKKKQEFQKDICAFANAEGGYIIYGVGESKGVPSVIKGITIENIDKFELDRINDLNPILPMVTNIYFHFINIDSDRYIVVVYIQRGFFNPYTISEEEGKYSFFTRHGN